MACPRALALALLFQARIARADDAAATLSLAIPETSFVRVEPSVTFDDGHVASEVFWRGVLVYRGLLGPDLDADRYISGLSADLAFERAYVANRHVDGITDLGLTAASAIVYPWGYIGIGVALSVPTATNDAFGDRATELGPAWIGQLTALPHVELSLLARTFFDVTGRAPVSSALLTKLEPAVVVKLPAQLLVSSDGEIEIDWLTREVTVPINCELARSFGHHVLVQLGPEVDVVGPTRGSVKLDLRIDITGS